MKKHRFFAALTAAVVAISSALVFPSAAFAEEQVKTETCTLNVNETITGQMGSPDGPAASWEYGWGEMGDQIVAGAGLENVDVTKVTEVSIGYEITVEGGGDNEDALPEINVFPDGGDSNGDHVEVDGKTYAKDTTSGTITTTNSVLSSTGIVDWRRIGVIVNCGRSSGTLTLKITDVEVKFEYVEREDEPEGKSTYDLTENVHWLAGPRSVNQDSSGRYYCGAVQGIDPDDETPWQLEDIETLGDFFERYNALEMRFRALEIDGGLKAVGAITTKNGKTITLPAQPVEEGQNIYRVSLEDITYTADDPFDAVGVSLCSTTSSITSFIFLEYDSELLTATGTKTLNKDYKPASSVTAYINNEDMVPDAGVVLWGGDSGVALPASTLTKLYSEYKGGEITYNVSGLASNVDIKADIIAEYGEDNTWATLSSNNTVKNGKNTISFNLPLMDYWGKDNINVIWLRFHAEPEYVTSFKLINSTSSNTDEIFDKENEVSESVESSPDAAGVPAGDKVTSITINPAFNLKNKNGDNVELDLSKIKIKAKEIYDEESLARVEAALGKEIAGNKHYNLLDLTLLYNGEDFSNGYEGLVQVIIPLPTGHRDKTFSCYRMTEVNGKMVKEEIPGEQTEDSYIIYLEHFSLYALVADGGETATSNKPSKGSSSTKATDDDKTTANNNNPGTGAAGAGIAVALAATSAAALIVCRKKKHD